MTLYDFCILRNCQDLLQEWDQANLPITPQDITHGSRQSYWWKCPKGHRWQRSVKERTRGNGCPVCNSKKIEPGINDFATRFSDIAAQWHPTKNHDLTPEQVAVNSNRMVWWKCSLGHAWRAPVSRRVQFSTGCPYCAGRKVLPGFNDLATLEPAIAAQWDTEHNGALRPDQVTVGSGKRVWWKCNEGHVWKAKVYSRTGKMGRGCPVCAGVAKRNTTRRYHVFENQ